MSPGFYLFGAKCLTGLFASSTASNRIPTSLADLPQPVLDRIYGFLDLRSIGNVALVSKKLSASVMEYISSDSVTVRLFYSCSPIHPSTDKGVNAMYVLRGSSGIHRIDPYSLHTNFRQLGVLMKKLTVLNNASMRLSIACSIMHRINLVVSSGSNKELMSCFGTYFHTFIKGWTMNEQEFAARMVTNLNISEISVILQDIYIFGSNPMLEVSIRNFLRSFFFLNNSEPQENRLSWLLTMLKILVPLRDIGKLAKLLLLSASSLKEAQWLNGLQWKDNVEAVPACTRVASFRYEELVKTVLNLERLSGYQDILMKILSSMFQTPVPWIPENIGSFLLLGGSRMTRIYLKHLVLQTLQGLHNDVSKQATKEDFIEIGEVFLGLFLMQSRFRRSMDIIYTRFDELVSLLPSSTREPFFLALWTSISREMQDVKEGDEDYWAKDSYSHITRVIRTLGVRCTQRAFLHSVTDERMQGTAEE